MLIDFQAFHVYSFLSKLQPHDEWLYYHFHDTAIIITFAIVLDLANLALHSQFCC